jgi:hypothetical protein
MSTFLVGISWCDLEEVAAYKSVGLDDDPRCATGIFIVADTGDDALSWGNSVANKYMEFLFPGEKRCAGNSWGVLLGRSEPRELQLEALLAVFPKSHGRRISRLSQNDHRGIYRVVQEDGSILK